MNKKRIRQLSGILSAVNRVIPKRKKKIVFYSNMGFRDNVRAVFEYLLTCPGAESYKIICAVNDYQDFLGKGYPENVRFVSPLSGVYHFFTGRYFFYSFGKYPVKPSKKQMVINLWHGSPLKKIGNYLDDEDQNFFTYVLAASDFFVPVMQKAFLCDPDQIVVCGHPRNDALFCKNDALQRLSLGEGYRKVILWLPTFRKSDFLGADDGEIQSETGLPLLSTMAELEEVNERLMTAGALMIVKIHPAQNLSAIGARDLSNIRILSSDVLMKADCDLYALLSHADGLITDYSSVYFDYLLLNRPIGFTVDDMEEYIQNRGFVVDDPVSLMPGPLLKTSDDFLRFVSSVLTGSDGYAEERKRVGELTNRYHDGKDARRALELAGIL